VDDRTGQLVLVLTEVDADRWRWGTWWLAPGAPPGQALRFRVETVAEGVVCSEAFTIERWLRPEGPGTLEAGECALGLDP
jgi:hypothetical protein